MISSAISLVRFFCSFERYANRVSNIMRKDCYRQGLLLSFFIVTVICGFAQSDVLTPSYREHSLIETISLETWENDKGRYCWIRLVDKSGDHRSGIILNHATDGDDVTRFCRALATVIDTVNQGPTEYTSDGLFGDFEQNLSVGLKVDSTDIFFTINGYDDDNGYWYDRCPINNPSALLDVFLDIKLWFNGGIPDPFLVFGGYGNSHGKILISKEEVDQASRLLLSVGEYDVQVEGGRLLLLGYMLELFDNTGATTASYANERCPEIYDDQSGEKIPCSTRHAELLTDSMKSALSKLGKGDSFRFTNVQFALPNGAVRNLGRELEFEVR